MNTRKITTMGILILLALAMPQFAIAQGGMMNEGMMGGGGMHGGMGGMGGMRQRAGAIPHRLMFYMHHAEAIGLSEEQAERLEQRWNEFRKNQIGIRADIQVARLELQEMLEQENVNLGAVEKQVDALQELRSNLMMARIRADLDARNILTPEQRRQAGQLMRRMNRPGGMQGRQQGNGSGRKE